VQKLVQFAWFVQVKQSQFLPPLFSLHWQHVNVSPDEAIAGVAAVVETIIDPAAAAVP
jgi:hypothetical protein